jgi:hypothetical protein
MKYHNIISDTQGMAKFRLIIAYAQHDIELKLEHTTSALASCCCEVFFW